MSPERDELPLADYDQLPAGCREHRIRALDARQPQQILDY